ncbi:hypothetical protein Q4575_01505 [Psychrosphaera sp. 1_MG-2023]|uniref:hypothetical protein n=1 Tax=Psychrosphaera sp. 1_MG-2023 TaxID=3062643 RepID=UPI0026E1FB0F|nr:hypothetical protein [Psychrosphaera sp. 1_MG-2023]MDO6718055.1 hypothetical protein [Psychrosphaera sp. 1_MG-2023]
MNIIRTLIVIFVFFNLYACKEQSNNIPAFANPNAPEYRALTFFDAIYNQNDISLLLKYVTKKHARIIKSYGTPKGYSRYVLNMQFDKGVDLKIDRTLNQVKVGDNNTTSVNILFTGKYLGALKNDLRKVKFVKEKGEWLIAEIADDPYARQHK